jgi:glycine cleavage system H protein
MSQNPKDLRYTKDHEWARKEGDLLRVGITLHAVGQLGDITLVDLAAPGTRLAEHARFGDIESVKAVSELFAPVAGEIVERNGALESSPETVNADAYGEGWMVLIKPDDAAAFDALLDAHAYDTLLGSL